ncbi:MAG: methionine biosynthesis protein MetW [Planctomycetaceae bacterium]|nr:methionine biosynthesis protein MetW [Planctomycetaceae bacterium]
MPDRPRDRHDRRYCIPDPLASLTDETIVSQIPYRSRVLDLGCGDGRLLKRLRDTHGASVQGIEIDQRQIVNSIANGVPVIHADLDRGLEGFPDRSFDFAVLSQTLQQVRHPRVILHEMLRVAAQSLVVVPNFGNWRVRLGLLLWGQAPKTASLPYEWYDTPNLHFMSMIDFRALVDVVGGRIVRELPMIGGRAIERAWAPNLRAEFALYVLERKLP